MQHNQKQFSKPTRFSTKSICTYLISKEQVELQDVANLGQLGAFRQGLTQSQLQADMDAARTGAYEPFQRLQQYGAGLGQLAGFGSPATTIGSQL